MKKIIKSLSVIVAVAVIVVGGTMAYFSDTETSSNNVISAGTIDIAVDSENPWSADSQYDIANLVPSDETDINVTLENVGTNDVVIWKKVSATDDGNLMSEPECEAEGGTYSAGVCTGNIAVDDISSQFVYSMDIGGSVNIDQAWDVRVSDINDLWIPVGRLDAGDSVTVNQNYYFDENAGNEYQGDSMTLDITFYAEQLDAPGPAYVAGSNGVILDNKNASNDWAPVVGDQTWGILTWDGSGNYEVNAWGLAGASYELAYYDEATSTQTLFGGTLSGVDVSDTGTRASLITDTDAKYWLRDLSWDNDNTLWESNLVNN